MAANSGTKAKNNSRFARYFALTKGREHLIDKDDIVMQFTEGRTTHLSEMTNAEFHEMCDAIEGRFNRTAHEEQIRKARNAVLLRIGRLGINTIDNWDEVNAFLLSKKIAGKLLYEMSLDELKSLPEASLDSPFKTAALAVCALCAYAADRGVGTEMLNYIKGPRPLSNYEISF